MKAELIERRVLGALRFVDATTGLAVERRLAVGAPGITPIRNRSGLYVVADPPTTLAATPAPVTLTVHDPSGHYLSRRLRVTLPRDPAAPGNSSLFVPVTVTLYPSPAAVTAPGWAVIRASVRRQGGGGVLPGALVLVRRGAERIGGGMADARGEALIPVAGLPVTTWGAGAGPVVVNEIEVTLVVIVDPAAADPPDPDDLEARQAGLPGTTRTVNLAAGRHEVQTLSVTVPP